MSNWCHSHYEALQGYSPGMSAKLSTALEYKLANEITANMVQLACLRHYYGAVPYCCASEIRVKTMLFFNVMIIIQKITWHDLCM